MRSLRLRKTGFSPYFLQGHKTVILLLYIYAANPNFVPG